MNTRFKAAWVLGLVCGGMALCAAGWCVTSAATLWQPHSQTELLTRSVYAYRQWQSTGIYLNTGDRVTLTAAGQWSYSPEVGLNGPEGGLWAPGYYPLPEAPGGALLGRVGENGQFFYVGCKLDYIAPAPGLLYLGINDDALGDNVGDLTLKINVGAATSTP